MKEIIIGSLMFLLVAPLHAQVHDKYAGKPLSKNSVKEAEQEVIAEWKQAMQEKHAWAWKKLHFKRDSLRMFCAARNFGAVPEDGRCLFISMHGGGKVPEEVNNQQWMNQIYLYEPAEGVYVAPRAPWDDSDMWHKKGLDGFFEDLIQACVVFEQVNPDKVYLLGYSAGGDGVWRMAPRMADRWAASSMMAGHPGNASQVNLRNLPYMIWMGEHDSAYDRNRLAAEKGMVMDSLRQSDPEGYIHETHIMKGMGHWMEQADTAAISWMTQYKRNPYPNKIVWRQEEVLRPAFYWLSAPENELAHGKTLVVERKENNIYIETCDYNKCTLYLNDEMFDLDKPIKVYYKGKRILKKRVTRSIETMRKTINERGDYRYMFPVELEVKIK
jgi:hypothetical protein